MKKKRIIIITQYFYPENFRINELANSLVKKGYDVDALVGIPNYPDGVYFADYGLFKNRYEIKDGVKIYRCFQFPRGKKASNVRLAINYLSFVFCSCFWVLFKFAWKKKYDAVIAFEPSPITQIIPAILLGKLRHTKVLSWIQDIWPDSITDNTTDRQNRMLLPPLNFITEFVYKHSDKILISSKGMESLVCRNRNYQKKIEYVPNWCDDFGNSVIPIEINAPKGFNIMMAGNLGEGIGPDAILDVVKRVSDLKEINFLFVGSGSRVEYMKQKADEYGLENIFFLGRFPYESMGSVYNIADALFLTLRRTEQKHLDVTVPSRLQAYMSSGKPIFAMIGSGASSIIEENRCGFVVQAGDSQRLSMIIRENYQNRELLAKLGKNARKAYENFFTLEQGVEHFVRMIES